MNELESDGYLLDLSEDIPIPMNFAIADVKDPSKRKRNFSKTVDLPDTINNRSFFSGAFGLNVTDDSINFDATAKTNAVLKKNGVAILPNGLIKLNHVTRTNGDLSFNIELFSETVDIFLLLSNINISELDWSGYDHTLTQANIVSSWTATAGSGYYYPLIERGVTRPSLTTWRTTDFIPYVYFREVLTKCLDYAGVSYSSTFIDSTRFKSFVFGYGGGELPVVTAADLNLQKVDIGSGDYTYSQSAYPTNIGLPDGATQNVNATFANYIYFNDTNFTSVTTQDTLNQFDDAKIYPQQTGNFNLQFTIGIDWAYNVGAMTWLTSQTPVLQVLRNGAPITNSNFTDGWTLGGTTGQAQNGTTTYALDKNFYFETGDIIEFKFIYSNCIASHTGTQNNISLGVTTSTLGTIDMVRLDSAITDGSTIRVGQFLPALKCSEFLLGAIRQNNLYLSDPDIYGETLIEPLTDYYGNTSNAEDITQLIDHSKEFKVSPTANNYSKTISFKYKKNTDHDAGVYRERWDKEYGDFSYTQGSYYAKGEQKIELPWSTIVPYAINTEIILPRFVKFDANNNAELNKGAPRISINNGLKTGAWTLTNADGSSVSAKTDYPSIHHFDDYENPTFDINFGLVEEVYYDTDVVTNINTYSEYYSEFIQEMTNRAGKLIECYVKWDSMDVYRRDFGKLLMINGAVFRLNLIEDFAPDVVDTTKIELVKVLKAKNPPTRRITYSATIPSVPPDASTSKLSWYSTNADYDIELDKYDVIEADTSGITLSTGGTVVKGDEIQLKNSSTGNITIDFDPFTFEGNTTQTLSADEAWRVGYNGTEWKIL